MHNLSGADFMTKYLETIEQRKRMVYYLSRIFLLLLENLLSRNEQSEPLCPLVKA